MQPIEIKQENDHPFLREEEQKWMSKTQAFLERGDDLSITKAVVEELGFLGNRDQLVLPEAIEYFSGLGSDQRVVEKVFTIIKGEDQIHHKPDLVRHWIKVARHINMDANPAFAKLFAHLEKKYPEERPEESEPKPEQQADPNVLQIPFQRDEDGVAVITQPFHFGGQGEELGWGMSSESVRLVSIAGIGEVAIKQAHSRSDLRKDSIDEEVVLRFIRKMQPPPRGVPQLLVASPHDSQSRFLGKEVVRGVAFSKKIRKEAPDGSGLVYEEEVVDREDYIPQEVITPLEGKARQRAEMVWGLLTDVFVPLHREGVMVSDYKREDVYLSNEIVDLENGGSRRVTKYLDYGNSKLLTPDASQLQGDTTEVLNLILSLGFGVDDLIPNKSEGGAWDRELEWLGQLKRARLPQAVEDVCTQYLNSWLLRTKPPFANAAELQEALRPYFVELGVADPKPDVSKKIAPLQDQIDSAQRLMQNHTVVLQVVNNFDSYDKSTPEYQAVARRLERGETLDEVRIKASINIIGVEERRLESTQQVHAARLEVSLYQGSKAEIDTKIDQQLSQKQAGLEVLTWLHLIKEGLHPPSPDTSNMHLYTVYNLLNGLTGRIKYSHDLSPQVLDQLAEVINKGVKESDAKITALYSHNTALQNVDYIPQKIRGLEQQKAALRQQLEQIKQAKLAAEQQAIQEAAVQQAAVEQPKKSGWQFWKK